MPNTQLPILYTFRRCPYAMRARMAIYYSGIKVEIREILLKDKPKQMLEVSSKGTVPVLLKSNGEVVAESREVIMWALKQYDPDNWYAGLCQDQQGEIQFLINRNDNDFKPWLDRYKYSVGYPEHSQEHYRKNAEVYLFDLNSRLSRSKYLIGDAMSVADIAIFPFIRQFAFVDKAWFDQAPYTYLGDWLNKLLKSELFSAIMDKYDCWHHGDVITVFPIDTG